MSEKENKRRMQILLDNQRGIVHEPATDEDIQMFLNVFFGNYKGPRYSPE